MHHDDEGRNPDYDDDDYESVRSSSSSSRSRSHSKSNSSDYTSESSESIEVDDETLYTLVWKDHIKIKLDKEVSVKIVDFGNACWTHKHFTDNI